MTAMTDGFGRQITYLRLSVTDRCDLRCRYCMPEAMTFLPRRDVLSLGELARLAEGMIARGIRRIRLTGGEPLVRKGVMDLVERLGRQVGGGLDELTLTTNATRLEACADALHAAGVRRINVSLDTLRPERYAALARRPVFGQVLRGIEAARQAGLAVKLNTVALKGVNEDEFEELVVWAHERGHAISFIEVMPMGEVDEPRIGRFYPLSALRERLEKRFTLTPSLHRTGGPARYADVLETGGRVGFISPLTENFCAGCNRVRVTATGRLHPCLGGGEEVDLRAALRGADPDGALSDALDAAMRIKPERHRFEDVLAGSAAGPARHMSRTGG